MKYSDTADQRQNRTHVSRPTFLAICLATGLPIYLSTAVFGQAPGTQGEAAEKPGWANEAQLSFVATDGNAETSSLGIGAKFERKAPSNRFEASFNGVRAESTITTRTAILADDIVSIDERSDSQLTAENYHAKARFDRDFDQDWFWHIGGSWERDEFAGIDHRFQGVGGIGHEILDTEDHTWRVDAGVTWTNERPTAGDTEEFFGIRLLSDWSKQATASTHLAHSITVDGNFEESEDYRVDTTFSVKVSISKLLSLQTALQVKYDSQPAFEEIGVVDPDGTPVDGLTAQVELEETDVKATVSLVIDF
ncbi:MAG: DUF481 domain-containing protein [Thermoanaerobaculia bacterium]|nr:DUF481 domain-containing protein [Thermoanaerobaculia bacterium]